MFGYLNDFKKKSFTVEVIFKGEENFSTFIISKNFIIGEMIC